MSDDYFMKAPCKHCPFRRDVKPFLHPERAADIAANAENRYGSFHCHKTTEHDDDSDSGEMMVVETTKACAGHLYMQWIANDEKPDGFTPDHNWNCYADYWEMSEAYEEAWNE